MCTVIQFKSASPANKDFTPRDYPSHDDDTSSHLRCTTCGTIFGVSGYVDDTSPESDGVLISNRETTCPKCQSRYCLSRTTIPAYMQMTNYVRYQLAVANTGNSNVVVALAA